MIDGTKERETLGTTKKVVVLPSHKREAARDRKKALCIPCAVASDEFRERAPASSHTPLDTRDGRQRAWIAGRGYELVHHPSAKVLCIRCGREAHVAYVPEGELIA